MGFTFERYIAVCHPLRSQAWCSPSRARRSLACIVVCATLYNVPRMLEYKYVYVRIPHTENYQVRDRDKDVAKVGLCQNITHGQLRG